MVQCSADCSSRRGPVRRVSHSPDNDQPLLLGGTVRRRLSKESCSLSNCSSTTLCPIGDAVSDAVSLSVRRLPVDKRSARERVFAVLEEEACNIDGLGELPIRLREELHGFKHRRSLDLVGDGVASDGATAAVQTKLGALKAEVAARDAACAALHAQCRGMRLQMLEVTQMLQNRGIPWLEAAAVSYNL